MLKNLNKQKYISILKSIFCFVVLLQTLVALFYIYKLPIGKGDEYHFINAINSIQQKGWITTIENGASLPHLILVYPLTFVLKSHFALRLFSVLVTGFLFYYLKTKNSNFNIYYALFYIGVALFFFTGSNDAIFNVSLVFFFYEVYLLLKNKEFNLSVALSALVIAFFSRALIIVYVPLIIICLWIIYKKYYKSFSLRKTIVPILLFSFFLLINLPSLIKNKTISYDVKPTHIESVSWSQMQYLSQIRVNEGMISYKKHVTWEETQQYLLDNGETSLPKTTFKGVTQNPTLTVKEFFKDFTEVLLYGSRQLGLILITSLILFGINVFKRKNIKDPAFFVQFSLLCMIFIFSLIIISYVELRWLAPVFFMATIMYTDLQKQKKLPEILILLNCVLLILLGLYGSYNLFNKALYM